MATLDGRVPENALLIEDLLHRAAAADADVHQQAVAATYAGEADPYKKPRADDDEDDLDADLGDEDEVDEDTA